jgi:hypothetical protein
MKHSRASTHVLLPLVCAIGLAVLVGCVVEGPPPPPPGPPGPPGPPVAAGYDYYYYPDEEVYFYPATGVYFWFGGGGWHSGPHVPGGIVLHERVSVRLNSPRPYEQHETIRTQYPRRAASRPEEGGEHGPR